MWIKETVEKLTKTYKTNNPFELAEAMNINVYQRDLHNEIMGFYKYIRKNKFIFINSNLNSNRQLFTCAHELGHSQLHPRINTPFLRSKTFLSVDKIEQEANRFAVELLLPDECLYNFVSTDITIKEIAATYGIPKQICHLKNFTQLLGN